MAAKKTTDTEAQIIIPAPNIDVLSIPIVGTSPLVVHSWSQKAKQKMLDDQMGKPKIGREPRNPDQDYLDSRYINEDGGWDGVPAVAFKAAMVGATRVLESKSLPMTLAKRLFFVEADGYNIGNTSGLVRIYGEPVMREDTVRLQSGVADLRYRAQYYPWRAVLRVRYVANVISAEQVANLVQLAGITDGVCEWRPSSPKSATGTYGLWQIEG